MRQVSLKAKLGEGYVSELLRQINNNPGIEQIDALAAVLNCDSSYLLGFQETLHSDPRAYEGSISQKTPVAEVIADGEFSAMNAEPWVGTPLYGFVNTPRSNAFPNARHFAFLIGDPAKTPREYALFVDIRDVQMGIVDGEAYLVRRSKDDGGGHEFTIKTARVHRDYYEMISEEPGGRSLIIPRTDMAQIGNSVAVVGLLYGQFQSRGRFG